MLRRSGVIALAVGTVLTAINQGDMLLTGHWTPSLVWKLPMTYAVPFIVATLGALGSGKAPTPSEPALPRPSSDMVPPPSTHEKEEAPKSSE